MRQVVYVSISFSKPIDFVSLVLLRSQFSDFLRLEVILTYVPAIVVVFKII
jgi:hypothetical protein